MAVRIKLSKLFKWSSFSLWTVPSIHRFCEELSVDDKAQQRKFTWKFHFRNELKMTMKHFRGKWKCIFPFEFILIKAKFSLWHFYFSANIQERQRGGKLKSFPFTFFLVFIRKCWSKMRKTFDLQKTNILVANFLTN